MLREKMVKKNVVGIDEKFKIINNYQECINKVDIVYMTRIQKERTN